MTPNDEQTDQTHEPEQEVPAQEATAQEPDQEPVRSWQDELDTYPLRDPSEDPRWALRIVWGWVGFAIFSIVFIVALIILGAIYD